MLIDIAISGDRNVVKKLKKILKCKDLTIEVQCMWNVEKKCNTNNNRGNGDYFKVIQKTHEQHTRKP
jgi:hypothetical protein